MKSLKLLLFGLLSLSVIATSCKNDDIDPKDINPDPAVYGDCRELTFGANFMTDLPSELPECNLELHLLYKGSKYVSAVGKHKVKDGVSTFVMDDFLQQGDYAILGVSFVNTRGEAEKLHIGLRMSVDEDQNIVPTKFCTTTQNEGTGTIDDPYIISSAANFSILNELLATDENFTTKGMYFQQVGDLDFFDYEINYEDFDGICEDKNRPFMGVYNGANVDENGNVVTQYKIRNLNITRSVVSSEDGVPASGLFAHICAASIKNVVVEQPNVSGYNWVGGLVGAVLGKAGSDMCHSYVTNCKMVNTGVDRMSSIIGKMNVGGLVGGLDGNAGLSITDCANEIDNTGIVKTDFSLRSSETDHVGFCGGLVGGGTNNSEIIMTNCTNKMPVIIDNIKTTALGGLVGCSQGATITNCVNEGEVRAVSGSLGTGGIIGGSADVSLIAVKNVGDVAGGEGVGGIVGSSLLSRDDESGDSYGNVLGSSMINTGTVTGELSVGGIAGAVQASLSNCLNEGVVTASGEGVGGVIGYAPGSITNSCYNVGNVSGSNNIGGIVGYSFLFLDNSSINIGSVASSGTAGGILGMGGTVGTVNYSVNYGQVNGDVNFTGGITGKVGTCAEDEVDHMLIIKEDGEITVRTIFVFISEKFEEKHKLAKAFSVIFKIGDGLKGLKALWHGTVEEIEMQEEKEEISEMYEEHEAIIEQASDDYLDAISARMDSYKSKMVYQGEIPTLTTDVDIADANYDRAKSYRDFLLLSDEFCDDYSTEVNETLADISAKEVTLDKTKEAFAIITECVISIVAIAVGGPATAIVLGVSDMAVSKAELWTEDDNNAIVISQVSNYGTTNGCGIVGKACDQLKVWDCLSAGKVGRYTVADDIYRSMSVYRILVTGEYDRHDQTQAWKGYNSEDAVYGNILDVELMLDTDYFRTEEYYSVQDFFEDDRWKLDDDSPFALPYDNQYKSFLH